MHLTTLLRALSILIVGTTLLGTVPLTAAAPREQTTTPQGSEIESTYLSATTSFGANWTPIIGDWDNDHSDTVGLFDPVTGAFLLRNSNTAGVADVTYRYGYPNSGWLPVAGDWDGNGTDTGGLFDVVAGKFYLRNSLTNGPADATVRYGYPNVGWTPVVGDWDGNGSDTIGLFDPVAATFYLRNSLTNGPANTTVRFGNPNAGWIPVVGDWNGNGTDTIGLFDPVAGMFYLRNSLTPGPADVSFRYGNLNTDWTPVVGDWDGNGSDTIGLFDPVAAMFYLRNSLTAGPADISFHYGKPQPLAQSTIVKEARLDTGMPYQHAPKVKDRGCPSSYVGCGGPYHGFLSGVCTDLVLDAYNVGFPFDIQNALAQDASHNPGRYRWNSARNADDMWQYFSNNQQIIPPNQPYQAGDVAFFDWKQDGTIDHVAIVTEVDASGHPLSIMHSTGRSGWTTPANENAWNKGYDAASPGHGRLRSTTAGFGSSQINTTVATAPLEVLYVEVDSSNVTLRLLDANGKQVSKDSDENMIASNNSNFIPYIPGGQYVDMGAGKSISVVSPFANARQYTIEVIGSAVATYNLNIQTRQDGAITASQQLIGTVASGETQVTSVQLSMLNGVLSLSAATPTSVASVATPSTIQIVGTVGQIARATVALTETGQLPGVSSVSFSVSDGTSQLGETIGAANFTLTPSSVSIAAGATSEVQLSISLDQVLPGQYLGSLTVIRSDGIRYAIPLSLVVEAQQVFLPSIQR